MSELNSPSNVAVERLPPGEWSTLRDLLLAALQDSPDSFGSAFEKEERNSEGDWRAKFETCEWFVARGSDEAVGLVGLTESWDKSPGEADLVSMWIAPNYRGMRVAPILIDAVRLWALGNGVDTLALWVIEGRDRARRVYEKYGFVPTYACPVERDASLMAQKFGFPLS